LPDTDSKPISIDEPARNINAYFRYRRKVSEGAKGPIVYEFTRRRGIQSAAGLPHKSVWLLIRRTLDEKPEYGFFISHGQKRIQKIVKNLYIAW